MSTVIDGANRIADSIASLKARALYDYKRRNRKTFLYDLNNEFTAQLEKLNVPPYCAALFAAAVHSKYVLLVEVLNGSSFGEIIEDFITNIKNEFEAYKNSLDEEHFLRGVEESHYIRVFAEELANNLINRRVKHVYSGSGSFLEQAKSQLTSAIYNLIVHESRAIATIMGEAEWYAASTMVEEAHKLAAAMERYDFVEDQPES